VTKKNRVLNVPLPYCVTENQKFVFVVLSSGDDGVPCGGTPLAPKNSRSGFPPTDFSAPLLTSFLILGSSESSSVCNIHDFASVIAIAIMALRILPRALRSCRLRTTVNVGRVYQIQRYSTGAAENKDKPASSAEHVPTSHPPFAKQVPLTVDSHGPVKQNPQHTKNVFS
jgi:hypothetical protein